MKHIRDLMYIIILLLQFICEQYVMTDPLLFFFF